MSVCAGKTEREKIEIDIEGGGNVESQEKRGSRRGRKGLGERVV